MKFSYAFLLLTFLVCTLCIAGNKKRPLEKAWHEDTDTGKKQDLNGAIAWGAGATTPSAHSMEEDAIEDSSRYIPLIDHRKAIMRRSTVLLLLLAQSLCAVRCSPRSCVKYFLGKMFGGWIKSSINAESRTSAPTIPLQQPVQPPNDADERFLQYLLDALKNPKNDPKQPLIPYRVEDWTHERNMVICFLNDLHGMWSTKDYCQKGVFKDSAWYLLDRLYHKRQQQNVVEGALALYPELNVLFTFFSERAFDSNERRRKESCGWLKEYGVQNDYKLVEAFSALPIFCE